MRSAFTGLQFEVLDVGHDGDHAWLRLMMQGLHTGPFVRYRDGAVDQVIPPMARRINVEQIHLLALRDGQVVDHRAVRDDMTILSQLGAFPPRPSTGLRMAAWKGTGRAGRAGQMVSTAAKAAAAAV